MLKPAPVLKFEKEAAHRLQALLDEVPFLSVESVQRQVHDPDRRRELDFLFEVKSNGRSQRLVCEVKRSGHPASCGGH
jgi:hypothetical protein